MIKPRHSTMKVIVTVILLIFIGIVNFCSVDGITVTPHYETKSYQSRERYYYTYCRSCGWWWWRRSCCYRRYRYHYVTRYYRSCQAGYTGTRCNVPICSPRCRNGGLCVDKNTCDCPSRYIGGTCTVETCSWATDCYPGICQSATTTCSCSPEFEGSNCQTMKEGAIFRECFGQLLDDSSGVKQVVATKNCSEYGDVVAEYTNQRDFTHMGLKFAPTYRQIEDLPRYPDGGFLREYRVGVISARGVIDLYDTNDVLANTLAVTCTSAASRSNPHEVIICESDSEFTLGISHNQQLRFRMFGTTGGFKQIRKQNTPSEYVLRYFTGQEEEVVAVFEFDIEPPHHCSESSTCEVDGIHPIVLDSDRSQSADITLTFTGWNDTDSGLQGFKYHVYEMHPNAEGILQNDSTPVLNKAYDLSAEEPNSTFTLPGPGLFSILGEVMDFAGNIRYTRAFVLYDDGTHEIEITDTLISVLPGPSRESVDGAYWLDTTSGDVTVSWKDRYQNKFLSESNYMNEIAPLHHPDLLDNPPGNISTEGTTNWNGIIGFQYALEHRIPTFNRRRRRQTQEPPTSWIDVDSDSLTIPLSRSDGNAMTFWIRSTDQLTNQLVDSFYIRVDSTPPEVIGETHFRKNVIRPDVKGYFSGVDMQAHDYEGGIHRIVYSLYDTRSQNPLIRTEEQTGQRSQQDQATCQAAGSCLCTNRGECYRNPQRIYLDNCWFVLYAGVEEVRLEGIVFNRAGKSTNFTTSLGTIEGLDGIAEYPKIEDVRLKDAFGYVVILTWNIPVSCYPIRNINIDLEGGRGGQALLTGGETEVELNDLVPYTEYIATIVIQYQGRRDSEPVAYTFNTGEPSTPQDGGLNTGAYVGIAVGGILFLLLIAVVVLVLVRIRQKKSPVPRRIVSMKDNIMKRMSRRYGHEDTSMDDLDMAPPPYPGPDRTASTMNVAYSSGPKLRDFEEDLYTYGELQTDPNAKWKHSDDKLKPGKTIYQGRFAEIKEGILCDQTGTRKVAIKMLRAKNKDDLLLMKAKMNFMATSVPNQNNIVNFIGAITEGPIILLEHCEQSLKDWMKSIGKVTDQVEDDMINFATDVARGMSHLHEHEIIHRRLGARNVLLKKVSGMGRQVAKVTGFGPMKGESSTGAGVESEKERIPMKWMAIEQMGIEKGETRPYNEKTDVWSYGVTAWEIFSKGSTPFAQIRSTEVRAELEKGVRMQCPEYCSDDIYKEILRRCWLRGPDERPDFEEITSHLVRHFDGAMDGDEYYADKADPNFSMDLYDDTTTYAV